MYVARAVRRIQYILSDIEEDCKLLVSFTMCDLGIRAKVNILSIDNLFSYTIIIQFLGN